jgi:hypothetical protein
VSWTDEEAQVYAAALIGVSEAAVRSMAADAGVELRVVHAGRSEWHTNQFQRHGVTVVVDDGVVTQATPG